MKPTVITLLLTTTMCQVHAQPIIADDKAVPAARPAPEQPATTTKPAATAKDIPCPHCNREEQLVIDLVYYKQVLDILEAINQQRDRIDAGLLQSVDAELIRIRPDLAALLKTRKAAPKASPAPAKKPAQPVKKPAKPRKKPAPKQGIDGLTVGHVNDENQELGIKSSVVLISNGRPRSLAVGSVIEHNRRRFKIVKVEHVKHRGNGNRHEVHLEDQGSKQVHIVPWQ